jgi:hypothetical protein
MLDPVDGLHDVVQCRVGADGHLQPGRLLSMDRGQHHDRDGEGRVTLTLASMRSGERTVGVEAADDERCASIRGFPSSRAIA